MTFAHTLLNRRQTIAGLSVVTGSAVLLPNRVRPAAAANINLAATFNAQMRSLWEDHIAWTRLYIVSAVAALPDLEATTNRLLTNQDDIGAAVGTYYGDQAGSDLAVLLRDHILGAAKLLTAAKAGDTDAVASASTEWYANAKAIGTFLAAANPDNWTEAALTDQMNMHLDMTLTEATAQLSGDFTGSVQAYDAIRVHILGMADVLSSGIIAQFPAKFA
ncbi:MAG TPA: hypothetical protein PK691_10975 [Thermomicrobiales bacterium]|nr:hypothetical protein [Thermomicrobiales bacterium]